MLAKVISGALNGVEGYKVEVEVDVSQGLPGFDIVGLPDSAVKESKERVRTAIKNCGCAFPVKRITVNLAPADTRKEGPSFDLPIAVGILACIGVIKAERIAGVFFSGELSLDGAIRPINGVLPMAHGISGLGIGACVVPFENGEEAALVKGLTVYAVKTLSELIAHLSGVPLPPVNLNPAMLFSENGSHFLDFSDVRGQDGCKRALTIAAAGAHNVLMIGPPGSGKTMMANRLPGILPDLTFTESMEVTKIYSIAGLLRHKNSLITRRPFRAPHHTISYSALTGGGRVPKPGEISLAHNGVLFLDELPEFQKNVLEVLRQPMEDGHVTIARVNGTLTYPSDFMLFASMNPCPCGYYGAGDKCTCTQNEINKYLGKISGPLLDRIDIQVEAPAVAYDELGQNTPAESSESMKKRVLAAIDLQKNRFQGQPNRFNAGMTSRQIETYCVLGEREQNLLKKAFDQLGLSGRAYHKILKVARTIADMEASERIMANHLTEAISYRSLDRKYWG